MESRKVRSPLRCIGGFAWWHIGPGRCGFGYAAGLRSHLATVEWYKKAVAFRGVISRIWVPPWAASLDRNSG